MKENVMKKAEAKVNNVDFMPSAYLRFGGEEMKILKRIANSAMVMMATALITLPILLASRVDIAGFYHILTHLPITILADKLGSATMSAQNTTIPSVPVSIQGTATGQNGLVIPDSWPRQVTYAWTSNGGTFNSSSGKNTIWNAPAIPGTYAIHLTAYEPPISFQDPRVTSYTHVVSTETLFAYAVKEICVTQVAQILTSLETDPAAWSLPVTGTKTLTVIARNQFGGIMPPTPVSWTCDAAAGTLTYTYGTYTIFNAKTLVTTGWAQASTASLIAICPINITAGPLAKLAISPSSASVPQNGGTKTFTVTAHDPYNNVRTGDAKTWSVDSLGSVNPTTGETTLFTAGATIGSTTLRVTSGTIQGTASIEVIDWQVKFDPISTPQKAGVGFPVKLTIPGYNGSATLYSSLGGTITPTQVYVTNGTWTGTVILYKSGTPTLNANYGSVITSNSFRLKPGKLTDYSIAALVPAYAIGGQELPPVTLYYIDEFGNNEADVPSSTYLFLSTQYRYTGGTWLTDFNDTGIRYYDLSYCLIPTGIRSSITFPTSPFPLSLMYSVPVHLGTELALVPVISGPAY